MAERIGWIDALKGFAIFTVVFGHCVTDCMSSGNYPEHSVMIKTLYDMIYSFHMPLFFLISGFVFYLSKSYRNYKRKVLDFIGIYVIWSAITWIMKYFASGNVNHPVTMESLYSIFWKPMLQYWYLYVLILFYFFCSLLRLTDVKKWQVIFSGICAIAIYTLHPAIGILNAAIYHLYFFLAGGYIASLDIGILLNKKVLLGSVAIVVLNAIGYYSISTGLELLLVSKKFIIANAISVICLITFCRILSLGTSEWLKLLGTYTLQIYVVHIIITGGLRVAFKVAGIHNIYLYFLVGTILGIVVPIIMGKVAERSNVLNIAFAPYRSIKNVIG